MAYNPYNSSICPDEDMFDLMMLIIVQITVYLLIKSGMNYLINCYEI